LLVTNPKISRLAAVGRFYVPLSQTQQNELVTAITTIDNPDALPSWMSDYFGQVEQMFEADKAGAVEKHGTHDQGTHGRRSSNPRNLPNRLRERRATVEEPSFTDDEFDAVNTYSTDAALQVNHKLRGLSRTRGIQPAQGVWRMSDKKIDAVVAKMDSSIDKSTLVEKTTLYREIPVSSLRTGLFSSAKGKTISDKGFLSMRKGETSIPPRKGFVSLQINAPAGTKALDLSFINPNAMGEVILPRGSKVKIINIVGRSDDMTVIGEIVD
jgi:hypothetical protein